MEKNKIALTSALVMFLSCGWPLCCSLSEMQNLLHGSPRWEKFLCIEMELKQTAVALWNQMDGRILPLLHDYVKDLHIFRTEIITSQPNSFGKTSFLWRGLCNTLGLGWYSARQWFSRMTYMLPVFILFQAKNSQAWHSFCI